LRTHQPAFSKPQTEVLNALLPKLFVEDGTFVSSLKQRLEVLGILYCEATKLEKATALYDILQEEGHERISTNDKDFKNVFIDGCKIVTLIINQLE